MNGIEPVVRHMLLCDDVQRGADQPNKMNIFGLVHAIEIAGESPFPYQHPILTVYLVVSSGRGSGQVKIVGVEADSNNPVFHTPERPVQFSGNPLAIQGMTFRILGAIFPQPGLYYIQFWYNDIMVAQQPLIVRSSHAASP